MKRVLAAVLAIGLVGSMLAGCGSRENSESGTGQGTTQDTGTENAAGGEITELELWHYWTDPQDGILEDYIENFNESHPDIHVTAIFVPYAEYSQKALTQAAAGNTPDIFVYRCNDTATLAEAGVLGNMTQIVEDGGYLDRMLPLTMASHEYNGEYYGLPIYGNCLGLFYNKNLVPEPPETWDDMLKICEEVSTADRYGLGVSAVESEEGTFQFLPWLWSAGADLDSIDSEAGISAFELYRQLIQNEYTSKEIVSWSQNDLAHQFSTGRCAMMINGPWTIPIVEGEERDFDYGVAVIPSLNAGGHASILGGESLGVSNDTDLDAVNEFFAWLYSEEIYINLVREIGQMPADEELLMDAYYQDDPIQKAFADNLIVAKPRAYGPSYLEMSEAIQTAYSAVISGVKEPADAAKEAASIITPFLEQ